MNSKNPSAPSSSPNAKRPLSVGDRVRIYKPIGSFVGTITCMPLIPYIVVTEAGGKEHRVHPKQCRRLKQKSSQTPRRVWVRLSLEDGTALDSCTDLIKPTYTGSAPSEWVGFQEILPGTVTLSRETLAKAWVSTNGPLTSFPGNALYRLADWLFPQKEVCK